MTAPVPAIAEAQPIDATTSPVPAVPDRADAPVSEVAERFLKAVVAAVPLALIEELHLFSPLRQGTVETGIAVLAARVPEPAVEETGADEPGLFGDTAAAPAADALTADASTADASTADDLTTEALAAGESASADDEIVFEHDVHVVAAEGDDDEDVSEADDAGVVVSAEEGEEAEAMATDETAPAAAPVKPVRHTVYTARYRYVIKGPERGRWESSIKAEADAPLVTVETVVRGVQRRAGEESEIVRYTGAQIARALRVPYPG